jgi:hypothetical protein
MLPDQFVRIPAAVTCAFILIFSLSAPARQNAGPDGSFLDILQAQIKKHPLMQVQDVYKLIYQSAFGNSHILLDPGRARNNLDRELAGVRARDMPLLENISPDSSLVRVNLCAFRFRRLDGDLLFTAMLQSAGRSMGAQERFRERWHDFVKMVELDKLPFKPGRVKAFGTRHLAEPREMHHSEIYRINYDPHYRVVRREVFARLFPDTAR